MKNKNNYKKPEAEIIKFSFEDIITDSLGGLNPLDPPEQPSSSEQQ